jgi:hypothetical protein|tara:strand:+ start:1326 stop:1928 length:603 start_codon:yes stop_codon:yes gene_type:complete
MQSLKITSKFHYLIFALTLFGSISAQDKIQNINFIFANNGYGFGYEYESFVRSNLSIGADLRFYDIRNDEYPVYDPYYNQVTVAGEKDILLFPLFFRTNYYLFEGLIANNFRPYLTFSIGPFIAVDGDETISSFSKKWRTTESQTNMGGSFGFGVSFPQSSGSNLSLGFGYDHLTVEKKIHSKKDFGGGFLYLKYQINRE